MFLCYYGTGDASDAAKKLLGEVRADITSNVFDDKFYQAKHSLMILEKTMSGVSCELPNTWGSVVYGGRGEWNLSCFIHPNTSLRGDFDGDGKTDVLVKYDNKWYIAYNGGTFSGSYVRFQDMEYLDHFDGVNLSDVAVGDFNGDGKSDVFGAFGDGKWKVSWSAKSDWKYLNQSVMRTKDLAFGDFDGNGKMDVMSAWGDGKWRVSWAGTSSWSVLNQSDLRIKDLDFGDFNGDGKTDIFATWGGYWRVSWSGTSSWKTLNSAGFLSADATAIEIAVNVAAASMIIEDLAFGDFNCDGKTDIMGLRPGGKWVIAWSGTSAGEITKRSTSRMNELDFESRRTSKTASFCTDAIANWEYKEL